MNPLKLFVGALLTVVLLAGAPLVWWWDRRGPNVPAPIVFHVLFFPVKIAFPPSLKAQLAQSHQALAQAVTNEQTLTKVLREQNDRVRALSLAGAGLRADAAKAAVRYQDAMARLSKPEAQIIAAGSGPGDPCVRAAAVDVLFLKEPPMSPNNLRAAWAVVFLMVGLGGCGTEGAQVKIETRTVNMPAPVSCVDPASPAPPVYADTPQALKAAKDFAERDALVKGEWAKHQARESYLETLRTVCMKVAP